MVELSVVLPAYNEGTAVLRAVERYLEVLPQFCDDFEIIVIDDGSRDDTWRYTLQASVGRSQVRALRNEVNRGQVGTLLRGFAEAHGSIVTHNGIDLPLDPRDTLLMLQEMRSGAEVVVVERQDRQAYSLWRKLISWSHVTLVRKWLSSPFHDHNFVQCYHRDVLAAVPVESSGVSTVTTELILKAQAAGYEVRSIKANYDRRLSGTSSITIRKIVRTFQQLMLLRTILRRWRRNDAAEPGVSRAARVAATAASPRDTARNCGAS